MAFYKYAGFWRRLIAFTIDSTIVVFIFTFLFFVGTLAFFFGAMSSHGEKLLAELSNPAQVSPLIVLLWIFYILINIAYFTYFHGTTGRTPGKMILGLQVVSEDGAPISFGTAFLRSVGYLVSNILYLGFIWVAFDKRKQGWHDKIAGTVVILRETADESSGLNIPDHSSPAVEARTIKAPENIDNESGNVPPEG